MQFLNFSLRFDEVNRDLKVLSLYLKKYPSKNTPLLRLRATRSDLIFRLTRLHINVRIFFATYELAQTKPEWVLYLQFAIW